MTASVDAMIHSSSTTNTRTPPETFGTDIPFRIVARRCAVAISLGSGETLLQVRRGVSLLPLYALRPGWYVRVRTQLNPLEIVELRRRFMHLRKRGVRARNAIQELFPESPRPECHPSSSSSPHQARVDARARIPGEANQAPLFHRGRHGIHDRHFQRRIAGRGRHVRL